MDHKLTDAVPFEQLQQMQDALSGRTGLTCLIVDEQGHPITRISRPSAITDLLLDACGDDLYACYENLPATQFSFACPYTGFTNLSVPFVAGGKHLGSFLILSARTKNIHRALLEKTSALLHIDFATLCDVANAQPVVSPGALQHGQAEAVQLVAELLHCEPAGPQNMQRGQIAARVEHTVQLLNRFMNSTETSLLVCDYETGEILMLNQQCASWLGHPRDSLMGQRISTVSAQDFDLSFSHCTTQTMLDADGSPGEPYQWNDYSAMRDVWLRCTNQLVYWLDGRLAHLITYRDISGERRMQDELSRLAYYDRHMNLPNSLKLSYDLEKLPPGRVRGEFLICFDITALRNLNDAHGRKAGDSFLQTVVRWIEHQGFENATIYRIEGDEFVLRMSRASAAAATAAAHLIFERFADLWSMVINGQQISFICSVSLSVIGIDKLGKDDELLNIIERTLDISRREKKIVVYNEQTDNELKNHIQIQLSLKKCIKQQMKGFGVHYQPIVEPATGLWKGLEALCRWNSPELGSIPPLVFIREAEQLGLISLIGEWVLETSICQCKAWGLDELDGFFVSVNLSPVQIMNTSLINHTLETLRRHNFPGHKLSLEVTESTKLNFDNHTLGVIEKLQGHNIMIALDDFGTGYSTFNNMKNLPVKLVKTDHTFIRGIEQDHFMQYFYHILTELAHKTDMKLVVEGVETEQQLEIMLKNGVDYVQGYYFGRPMPPEELENKLENFSKPNPPVLSCGLNAVVTERLANGRESYLITTSTFNIQTQCMQVLLTETDEQIAFDRVLDLLGRHFGVSRAYVYRCSHPGVYNRSMQWLGQQFSQLQGSSSILNHIDVSGSATDWTDLLNKTQMIIASDIQQLPLELRELITWDKATAIVLVPLWNGPDLLGFMGLDDLQYHSWQPEEVIMLKNISMLMAVRMLQAETIIGPKQEEKLAAAALTNMRLPACVIDLETDCLLWHNTAYSDENLVGKPCSAVCSPLRYQAAQEARQMLRGGTTELAVFEYPDPKTGQNQFVHHCLVPWANGKSALLEVITTNGVDTPPMPDLHKLTEALDREI